MPMNVGFVGRAGDGTRFVTADATAVGWGESSHRDGVNGIFNYGAGDHKNYPVEVVEARYPLMVRRYGLRQDSGGRGKFRGGLGIACEYQTLVDDTAVTLWLERGDLPAWGLSGGESGAPTRGSITIEGVTEQVLKTPPRLLPKGSTVLVETGGGGGFGSPIDRDPDAAQRDLDDGYVKNWTPNES